MAKLNLCVSLKPIFWGKGRCIKTPIHATKPAKIASNLQKPDGLSVITPPELPNRLYPLKLNSLPGVGAKTGDKLMRNGISTIEQLCKLDRTRLKALWGNVWGEKVWYLIRGADLPLEETKKATIEHKPPIGGSLKEFIC